MWRRVTEKAAGLVAGPQARRLARVREQTRRPEPCGRAWEEKDGKDPHGWGMGSEPFSFSHKASVRAFRSASLGSKRGGSASSVSAAAASAAAAPSGGGGGAETDAPAAPRRKNTSLGANGRRLQLALTRGTILCPSMMSHLDCLLRLLGRFARAPSPASPVGSCAGL